MKKTDFGDEHTLTMTIQFDDGEVYVHKFAKGNWWLEWENFYTEGEYPEYIRTKFIIEGRKEPKEKSGSEREVHPNTLA